jgi:8-oxo-dGTP pyrophosphatase MutT (NUDIX family)
MEKFSNLKPDKEEKKEKNTEVDYKGSYIKVIKYEEYDLIHQKDCVFCIPYFIEEKSILIREEYIPSYKYKDGQEYHLSLVGGQIEEGETPEVAMIRELQEEGGIVLDDKYKLSYEKPLFIQKGNTSKVYLFLFNLTSSDYEEIKIKGDGSKLENKSKTIKIHTKYLNKLNTSDVITDYLLNKFKIENNLL